MNGLHKFLAASNGLEEDVVVLALPASRVAVVAQAGLGALGPEPAGQLPDASFGAALLAWDGELELWIELREEATAIELLGKARDVELFCGDVDAVGFCGGVGLDVGMLMQPFWDCLVLLHVDVFCDL